MEELLRLTRENNLLLREILKRIIKDENEDFSTNVIANIFADKLMNNI